VAWLSATANGDEHDGDADPQPTSLLQHLQKSALELEPSNFADAFDVGAPSDQQ
jgi:hypothetical protein